MTRKYSLWTLVLLTTFAGGVFGGFLVTMINSGGRCDINGIGEGWIETLYAGGVMILGIREMMKHD